MKCENCGIDHDGSYGSGRFCSEKCARGFSTKSNRNEISKKVSKTLGGTGVLKEKVCLECGKELKYGKKFCGRDCSALYRRKQLFQKWEERQEFPRQAAARTYLLFKNGHQCEICKKTEWMGQPIPLVMDHINGNSDDNSFNNCRLICRNCDGLLPTYCSKNKGNGGQRNKKRMQKYYNNKSY